MTKRIRTIRKINRALGIKLYKWQEKYIFGEPTYMPPERGIGWTTAEMIKLCLSSGEPMRVTIRDYPDRMSPKLVSYIGADMANMIRAKRYISELFNIYAKLSKARGLKLREIMFLDYDRLTAQRRRLNPHTTNYSTHIPPKIYDFRRRLSLWIYPKSDCSGCCLTCKGFNNGCRDGLVERMER